MKKGICFLITGIIILAVALICMLQIRESTILFTAGVLLAILGLYVTCILGIDGIFIYIRKEKLRILGWDVDHPIIIQENGDMSLGKKITRQHTLTMEVNKSFIEIMNDKCSMGHKH